MRRISRYLLKFALTLTLAGMLATYPIISAASTPHLTAAEEFQMSLYPFRMEGNSIDNYIRKFECTSIRSVQVKLLRITQGRVFALWDGQHYKNAWTPAAEVCLLSLFSGGGLENNSQVDFGFSENYKAGVSRSFTDNLSLPDTFSLEADKYADYKYSIPVGSEISEGRETTVYWQGRILFEDLTAGFALRSVDELTAYSMAHTGTTFLVVTLQPVNVLAQVRSSSA